MSVPERPEEELARRIVAAELAVPVRRYENGTQNSMVDHVIELPSGPVPLEVVGDHDVAHIRLWDALEKRGRAIWVPDLQSGWYVTLDHKTSLKRLERELPQLMRDWETTLLRDRIDDGIPDELLRVGVTYLAPYGERGCLSLSTEGWNSWDDPVELNEWVQRVLEREADVATKVKAFGATEGHVFIWASSGSAWAIRHALRDEDEDDLPSAAPVLPDGVTEVWVGVTWANSGRVRYSGGRWQRADVYKM